MQIKWKKICVVATIFIYFASFLIQSNLSFFQVRAAETNAPRVNIVAVLVDDKIYDSISDEIQRYATDYIQKRLSDTKALVMPLDLSNINTYDIYRMMENIYFDWLENVNSSLIGLIMIWNIPLPIVNQNGYIFPTVYPYVDFENQKYVWDSESKYFVSNWNINWQAEIWHGLINYWNNAWHYKLFFDKVKEYAKDPSKFIWDGIWYEDFVAEREWFLEDNYQYYMNKIIFAEDIWYQRYSPLMIDMFKSESEVDAWWLWWSQMQSTKITQQQIENSLLADYNDLFSQNYLSIMRENIFAWWRWIKESYDENGQKIQITDSDSSAEMIQLKDTLYLWNESVKWLIQNFNDLLEDMVDEKINQEKYSMDIVIPISYRKVTWKRIWFKCYSLVEDYENFYFGQNVRNVTNVKDLSIYRWTYRNLNSIEWLTYDDILTWNNAIKSQYEKTNPRLKSIWASFDIFSSQVEWNRWYMMTAVEDDLTIFEDHRTAKNVKKQWNSILGVVKRLSWPEACDPSSRKKSKICEELWDFAKRWWWWASAINLIADSVTSGKYRLSGYLATDSWRSIYDMWWFQSLLSWDDEWMGGTWWIVWASSGPQMAANSFKSYIKYSSPTQREWWEETSWMLIGKWYNIYENHTPDVHIDFSKLNFRNLASTNPTVFNKWQYKWSNKSFEVYYYPESRVLQCQSTEKYSYKFLNSVAKFDSTSDDEINGIEYDRYWDDGQYGTYYHEIQSTHDAIIDDMNSINVSFNTLMNTIDGINSEIDSWTQSLRGATTHLGWEYSDEARNRNLYDSVAAKIPGLQQAVNDAEARCTEETTEYYGCLANCTWDDDCICHEPSCSYVSTAKSNLENAQSQASSYASAAADHAHSAENLEVTIAGYLEEVSSKLPWEQEQIKNIYLLIKWLFANNIIWAMEYVINLEWLNPVCYSEEGSSNCIDEDMRKIWFLPSWIEAIESSQDVLWKNRDKILANYSKMYDLVMQQMDKWASFKDALNSTSKDSWNKNRAEEISGEILAVLNVSNTSGWETESVTLSGGSAKVQMDIFDDEMSAVKNMFSKLIEKDNDMPQIISAAKLDVDFRKRADKHEINIQELSDGDLITQYALWAKEDWYESALANPIQDLLRWATIHMSWMNILTPDRPIDSPRYVSMQSIAWNEIKLIYPNLFRVEVFNVGQLYNPLFLSYDEQYLLTWWQIKKQIIKYLSGKADEYNKILEEEYNKAGWLDVYYQKISNFNKLATPTKDKSVRPYGYFTYEDFLNAIGWTWMLDTIADILYYQNLTNVHKRATTDVYGGPNTIEEELGFIKESFDLNQKRSYVLNDYLMSWNEINKNSLLIPNYKVDGYEVAYINSDGLDYVAQGDKRDEIKENYIQLHTNKQNEMNDWIPDDVREFEDECNIPQSWVLPLFDMRDMSSPWLSWFICWLKQTRNKPFNLELSFDNTLWEMLSADSWEDYIKGTDVYHSVSAWWDAMQDYADDWASLIKSKTWNTVDQNLTKMQIDAENHNREVLWWDSWESNAMSDLSRNLKISNSNALLSDANPQSEIIITSAVDLWNIRVTMTSTWDGCLSLNGNNLCWWYSMTFNPKISPFSWVILSSDHKAWSIWLDIKIALWWNELRKVIKYKVSPSELDRFEFEVEDDRAWAWLLKHVKIVWYDRHNNIVDRWLNKYNFVVNQWRFLKNWMYMTWFSTNDFRDLEFYYHAPLNAANESEAVIQIIDSKNGQVMWTHRLNVMQVNFEVKLDENIILWNDVIETNVTRTLTEDESIYNDAGDLNLSKLHKLEIEMKDGKWKIMDVDSQVVVISKNGLVNIWQITESDWWLKFSKMSKMQMTWWKLIVYYFPTLVAGNDILEIDVPWLNNRIINLEIKPSWFYNAKILLSSDTCWAWEKISWEVRVEDMWGNLADFNEKQWLVEMRWAHCDEGHAIWEDSYQDDNDWRIEPYKCSNVSSSAKVNIQQWYGTFSLECKWWWTAQARLAIDWYDRNNHGNNKWWWWYVWNDEEDHYHNFRPSIDLEESELDVYPHGFWSNTVWVSLLKPLLPSPKSWLNIMYLNYFWDDRWNQRWYLSNNNKYIESLMIQSPKIITTTTQLVSENKVKKTVWKIDPWFEIKNYGNLKTSMVISWGNVEIRLKWITSMNMKFPSNVQWMTLQPETIRTILSNEKRASDNYVFFVPSSSDYSLKSGILYSWKNAIFSIIDGQVELSLERSSLLWKNAWTITNWWEKYWSLILYYPGFVPNISSFNPFEPGVVRYKVEKTFVDWLYNNLDSVWLFDKLSDFELESWYKSIQNSNEITERIWFLWDFKNITLFAQWEIVWEATKKFGSEFVINLWDPLLSRKSLNEDVYGTNFDGWIWQEIYADPENNIFGSYQIDFNNDWNEDLLVVYRDGTLKLSKNYWVSPDLRNMQDLMRIAISIKDVYVWDTNGDNYDDIIVLTSNGQLRVYLNNGWKFDVDGNLVCLNTNVHEWNISTTPSDLSELHQMFVEDIDYDWILDILTYDHKWYVKLFYGWSIGWLPNYVSTEKYACDDWWSRRQRVAVVDAFWVSISPSASDQNGMVRWSNMWCAEKNSERKISASALSDFGIDISLDENILTKMVKSTTRDDESWKVKEWSIEEIMNHVMENFDTSKAAEKFAEDAINDCQELTLRNELVEIPWDKSEGGTTYRFKSIKSLKWGMGVSKTYTLKSWWKVLPGWDIMLSDGDIMTVNVSIWNSTSRTIKWSFWDIIQWPWKLYDNWGTPEWIRFIRQKDAVVKPKDQWFSYIVDNIELLPAWNGDYISYEYDLEFRGVPLRKIDLTDSKTETGVQDIRIWSIDWCTKDYDLYHWNWLLKEEIKLQDQIDKIYESSQEQTHSYTGDMIEAWSDINQLPWIVQDKIERISLLNKADFEISNDGEGKKTLKEILAWWFWSLNVELWALVRESQNIERAIDDITRWMCNWFSFGWSQNCKWLPVPFNQAFLAPGKYHLFGCWELPLWPLEWWVPIFHFPWTITTPYWPMPFPWGLKAQTDDFLRAPWWIEPYASQIRIYAAPTLTAQLWMAICVGPYATANLFPSPLGDVAGNCIVFVIKPQCKSSEWTPLQDPANPNETFDPIIEDVKSSWTCMKSSAWNTDSPYKVYSYRGSESTTNGLEVSYLSPLGSIDLEMSAFLAPVDYDWENKNSIIIGGVDILWWEFSVNKIRWWLQQWITEILIDKWLNPQIRYIANQLTRMHVNVKYPDLEDLFDSEKDVINNIWDNLWEILESGKIKVDENRIEKWGRNDRSYQSLWEFNSTIANPFESLAALLNQSNILNISLEPITVKVPMIFREDVDSYSVYIQQWLSVNQRILEDWDNVLWTLYKSCGDEPEEKRQQCYARAEWYLSSLVEFKNNDWQKMINQIYANLVILQKYRNFPFEIYEWIHVIDRYMSEIASLIKNTLWYLSFWLSINAERYVWYVDAVVLIMNIIKTYQLLVDFPIEWSEKCGNCSNDTYDQYSCKLSMLCDGLSLPIFQIPNFKLPNITLDLTNIDLWLDIVLPEFNFQTIRIDLPDLPNIPEPPSFWANIKLLDLPDIPLLPEPPDLPELPSFIPQVNLELPILPPAPELPKLPNEIEWIIKAAWVIWKIYCIVKWKFWFVWEKSVKAKIEQLTQRTYEVKWIDNIMDFTNRSVAPIKNYWVDYEISSYVDFQFNFDDFYNYLDMVTKAINNLTTSSVDFVSNSVNSFIENNVTKPVNNASDTIDWKNINLNWTLIDLDKSDWNNWVINPLSYDSDFEWLSSDQIEYVDYNSAKSRLEEVLAYFSSVVSDTTFSEKINSSINKIENQINIPSVVSSNNEWLQNIEDEVLNYIDGRKLQYWDLAELINDDYDKFLAMVSWNELNINDNKEKILTFNMQLFNLDGYTTERIKDIKNSNPYNIILDNKKDVVDGYWNAINTNTADSLWLTSSQYLALRNNIWSVRQQVATLYSVTQPISSTKLIAENWNTTNKTLVAASLSNIWQESSTGKVVDPAWFVDWIFEKIVKWRDAWERLVKVVYSDLFTSLIWSNHYRTSPEEMHDIVLWNENGVYKKCYNQDCSGISSAFNAYYVWRIKEIPYEETRLDFWWNTRLKIADVFDEVKNWNAKWQSYEVLSFSWDIEKVDGYLIKLVDRIDTSYEKLDIKNSNVNYVLVLPNWTNIAEGTKLELLNKTKNEIERLLWKELLEIVYYDTYKDIANITLSKLNRKWYYARIASLKLDNSIYEISSPWSNQVVAWRQIVWDDLSPVGKPTLTRVANWELTSEWDELQWYVGTKYRLDVNRTDNVSLSYINLSKDGNIIDERYTSQKEDAVSTNISIHAEESREIYQSVWIDQFGNKTEKAIILDFLIPSISVVDIIDNGDDTLSIVAELSQDIDQWNVSFQRKRWESWKTMNRKGIDDADLEIWLWDKIVYWTPFSMGKDIAMYDKNDEVIAIMDPDTGEIKIQDNYKDLYEVTVRVLDNLIIKLFDKKNLIDTFEISVPIKELLKIDADSYLVNDLPIKWMMWMFNWWKAVSKDGMNVLLISPTWHLYSEFGLEWDYVYDRELGAISLTLYQWSDLSKNYPIKIWLKAAPLVNS